MFSSKLSSLFATITIHNAALGSNFSPVTPPKCQFLFGFSWAYSLFQHGHIKRWRLMSYLMSLRVSESLDRLFFLNLNRFLEHFRQQMAKGNQRKKKRFGRLESERISQVTIRVYCYYCWYCCSD